MLTNATVRQQQGYGGSPRDSPSRRTLRATRPAPQHNGHGQPRRTVEDQMQWRAVADQRVEERRCKEQAAQAPTNPQLSDRSRALASSRGWSHVDVADRLTAQGRLTAEKLQRRPRRRRWRAPRRGRNQL